MITRAVGALVAAASLVMLLAFGALSLLASSAAAGQAAKHALPAAAERRMVLATIEARMTDEIALEKVRGKLDALDGRTLKLAAELCDRIGRDEGTAGADIAFSLVTALIVLS